MITKLKLFFSNWKTSIPGVLALLCATDSVYLHVLPPEWEAKAGALCIFLVSIGLIAAKDGDKTNSGTAGPTKTLKAMSMLLLGLVVTGCAGTMLDGRVCTIATQPEIQQHIGAVVSSYTDEKDKAKAEQYLRTAGLTATALCEMVRAREAALPAINPAQ